MNMADFAALFQYLPSRAEMENRREQMFGDKKKPKSAEAVESEKLGEVHAELTRRLKADMDAAGSKTVDGVAHAATCAVGSSKPCDCDALECRFPGLKTERQLCKCGPCAIWTKAYYAAPPPLKRDENGMVVEG